MFLSFLERSNGPSCEHHVASALKISMERNMFAYHKDPVIVIKACVPQPTLGHFSWANAGR